MILFIFHPHRRAISPSSYYIMRGTKRVLPVVNSPSYLRLLLQLLLLETDAVSEEGEPFFDQLGASTFIPMAGLCMLAIHYCKRIVRYQIERK